MFQNFYKALTYIGNQFQPFFLLFIRIFWGISLMFAGWHKLADIPATSAGFEHLHIFFPLFNAYFVGIIEFVGGLLFIIGLGSRIIAIPLAIIMIVALLTAHADALSWGNPYSIIKESPFTYLMACLTIFSFGPGKLSLDNFYRLH